MRIRTLAVLVVAALALLALPATAAADGTVMINTTVDAQLVSVTLDSYTANFGVMGPYEMKSSAVYTVTNSGNVPVKLKARISDLTGPSSSTLNLVQSPSPLADQFGLTLHDTGQGQAAVYLTHVFDTTWPSDPTVGVTGTRNFMLTMFMGAPTTYGSYVGTTYIMGYAP